MMKPRALISPAKYVQGPGVLSEGATYIAKYGKKAFVVAGGTVNKLSPYKSLILSLKEAGVQVDEAQRNPEITMEEIERLTAIAKEKGSDVVVGLGGGKALDTAKAVANNIDAPVVSVPTIAATDAPTAAYAVVYTADGVFDRVLAFRANPNLVLVDSEMIVNAPVRFLVSGMGDALATWFEAETCSQSKVKVLSGGYHTEVALAIARLCYDILLTYGVDAKLAAAEGIVSDAVEKIIEANILLSGIGFESGGLAAAHSVHNGLTIREETHKFYHGEKVSFGVITQLVLEDRPPEQVREVIDFCLAVGLPVCLGDLDLEGLSRAEVLEIAKTACAGTESIHNSPFKVTPEMVAEAILTADVIGKARKEMKG